MYFYDELNDKAATESDVSLSIDKMVLNYENKLEPVR